MSPYCKLSIKIILENSFSAARIHLTTCKVRISLANYAGTVFDLYSRRAEISLSTLCFVMASRSISRIRFVGPNQIGAFHIAVTDFALNQSSKKVFDCETLAEPCAVGPMGENACEDVHHPHIPSSVMPHSARGRNALHP